MRLFVKAAHFKSCNNNGNCNGNGGVEGQEQKQGKYYNLANNIRPIQSMLSYWMSMALS